MVFCEIRIAFAPFDVGERGWFPIAYYEARKRYMKLVTNGPSRYLPTESRPVRPEVGP